MNAVVEYHVQAATADTLLSRLEGRQKSDKGERTFCPACGGRSRKLSVTEIDGKVLLNCFGGCSTADVLAAVGLTFADIMPPRHWPESPEERRQLRRAAREGALVAALPELAHAAAVVRLAAKAMGENEGMAWDDYMTLCKAEEVIGNARTFFCEPSRWRPEATR